MIFLLELFTLHYWLFGVWALRLILIILGTRITLLIPGIQWNCMIDFFPTASTYIISTFINKPSWWSRYFFLRVSPYTKVWIKSSLSYWLRDRFDVSWSISLYRHILTQCIWVLIMTLEDVGKRSNSACRSDFAVISYFLHNWQQILGVEFFFQVRFPRHEVVC